MPNGVELKKRPPKIADILGKPNSLTHGLKTPWKEELTSPFGLPGIRIKVNLVRWQTSLETFRKLPLPTLQAL